ncbi:TPA: hypothetical protein ACSP7Z_005161, partial [Serratia fonticola]
MINFDTNNGMNEHCYLSNTNLHDLNIEELAYLHLKNLTGRFSLKNCRVASSLFDLSETLTASFNNNRTNQYVPLMTSFAILDQLGKLYSPKNTTSTYNNGIKRALNLFSTLTKEDIESLVSLRNSLLHDGSLVSKSQHSNGSDVLYRLTKNGQELITHPIKAWDGSFDDDLSQHTSIVNLCLLRDLVFEIKDKCFNL